MPTPEYPRHFFVSGRNADHRARVDNPRRPPLADAGMVFAFAVATMSFNHALGVPVAGEAQGLLRRLGPTWCKAGATWIRHGIKGVPACGVSPPSPEKMRNRRPPRP